jgi:hypothetical protein
MLGAIRIIQQSVRNILWPRNADFSHIPQSNPPYYEYNHLCWAACALMLKNYLGEAKTTAADPKAIGNALLDVAKTYRTQGGSGSAGGGTASQEFDAKELNKTAPIENLPDVFKVLGIKIQSGPALDRSQLNDKLVGPSGGPVVLYYRSNSTSDGHVVVVAKRVEKLDCEEGDGYILLDPAKSKQQLKCFNELSEYKDGFSWTKTYFGCNVA